MVLFRGCRRMQDSSIQNARIQAETTVNDVDFRTFAFCILHLQCLAGPCDRIRFKPIRYKAVNRRREFESNFPLSVVLVSDGFWTIAIRPAFRGVADGPGSRGCRQSLIHLPAWSGGSDQNLRLLAKIENNLVGASSPQRRDIPEAARPRGLDAHCLP